MDATAASDPAAPVWPPPPAPTAAEQRILDALAQASDAYIRAAVLDLVPPRDPGEASARLGNLADAAVHSADPRLYALAYGGCQRRDVQPLPAACALLSTAQRVRLDGGNGLPWMYALADAARAGDSAARDDALFHLAASTRVDDRYADLGAAVARQVGPDDDAAAVAGFSLAVRSLSTMLMPPSGTLIEQCKGLQTADANRRQLCAAIADRLIERGSSLILQSVGASVDRAVTGSDLRTDRLHAERDALFRAEEMDFSCDGLRRNARRIQRAAQIGELAALREARAQPNPVPIAR